MFEKIKSSWQTIVGVLLFIMTGAFLYEKSKRESAEAIADNKETLDKVNEIHKEIASNDGKLESEEAKRADIKKETEKEKADDSDDASKFLGNR